MNEIHRSDDLQIRILRLLDGEAQDDEVTLLDAELQASPEARALFIQLATLHSALEEQANSTTSIRNGPVFPVQQQIVRQHWKPIRNALFAAAAVLVLSTFGLWLKMRPQPVATLAGFQVGPDVHFVLSHSVGDAVPAGNVLAVGSRLELSQGIVEGSFISGVLFTIEAPCDFTVLAGDRLSLAEGVAWFEVPPQAVGFAVQTRQLEIVDLGTRFGVIAPAGEPPEVHVITGAVAVEDVSSAKGKSVLKGGEAMRFDVEAGFQRVPLRPDRFMKSPPGNIIFQDDFRRDGSGALHGTTPVVTTDSATWVANSAWLNNGAISSSTRASAGLPFKPVSGNIYTLDVSFAELSDGGRDWVGMGFIAATSTTGRVPFDTGEKTEGRAWMLIRANPGPAYDNQTFLTGSKGASVWEDLTDVKGGNVDLRIVLDTSGGAGFWNATWYAKRPEDAVFSVVRSTTPLTSEAIGAVGFSSNKASRGSITGFSLTRISVPSTW
jgi:hypothetical protein